MEHSLEKYLERRTSRELKILLNSYTKKRVDEDYEYEIGLIFKILEKRAEAKEEMTCDL